MEAIYSSAASGSLRTTQRIATQKTELFMRRTVVLSVSF
jgi:hypothetical protein